MACFDENASILDLNDMVKFHSCPVAKIGTEEVERSVGSDVHKAGGYKNRLVEDKVRPDKAFLNLKRRWQEIVL